MSDSQDERPLSQVQFKRLIVCCDGTGQSATDGYSAVPTNVTRFARALKTSNYTSTTPNPQPGEKLDPIYEIPQIVLYQTGIGTANNAVNNAINSAFGSGVDAHILEAYTFFANNYDEGDELFLFGFSRGAFTARAIASLICNAGLLKKESLEYLPLIYDQYQHRHDTREDRQEFDSWMEARKDKFHHHKEVIIHILGLFDTVGSLGIPQGMLTSGLKMLGVNPHWNDSYGYHDTSFPIPDNNSGWRALIGKAYQALALDENRSSFGPTLLYYPTKADAPEGLERTGFLQCWFPGVHTDVGGGYERAYRDISDISLMWMIEMCSSALVFSDDLAESLKKPSLKVVDPNAWFPKKAKVPEDLGWGLSEAHDEYHTATFIAAGATTRTPGQYFLGKRHENGSEYETNEWIHSSVRMRMLQKKGGYKPDALKGFKLSKDEEGWKWTGKFKVGRQEEKEVVIREWGAPCDHDSFEGCLLSPKELELINNDEAFKGIMAK